METEAGIYLLNRCMASSGSIIKCFQGNFIPDPDYSQLEEAAAAIPPGSDVLILLLYYGENFTYQYTFQVSAACETDFHECSIRH